MEKVSTAIKPFDTYLLSLADDIGKDTLSKILALSGTLSSSPITTKDRESINDPYQLMKKMEEYGLISESKSNVLVDILREVHRNDLALEVEVRYAIGFGKHISREELQREIKSHRQQQKDSSPDLNETTASENVSTAITPFDTYLSRLADDIGEDTLSKILALSGTLSSSPITARDREKIDNPYQLMKKMKQYDLINESKREVLVDILREVHRDDLALEVEVRYAIGFGKHISREELQRKVKMQQKDSSSALKETAASENVSTAITPFDTYLSRLADDIGKDTFSKILALSGTLSSSPITTKDRESIKNAYQLMKKMEQYGNINESKSEVLVDILRMVHRDDLAVEVEVRYAIGFGKHISREELQREIKIHRQQQKGASLLKAKEDSELTVGTSDVMELTNGIKVMTTSKDIGDIEGDSTVSTTASRRRRNDEQVAEALKAGETAVTDDTKIAGLLQSTERGEVIEGVTSDEEKKYYTDAKNAESWIRDKLVSASGDDYGKDAEGAKALLVKHKRLEEEIEAYSGDINRLSEQAQSIISMDFNNPASPEKGDDEYITELVIIPYEVEETHIEEKVVEGEFVVEEKLPRVKALYAYKGHGVDVQQGDEMLLLNKPNKRWWHIRIKSGEDGYVPATYVKDIEPIVIRKTARRNIIVPEKVITKKMKYRKELKKKTIEGKDSSAQCKSSESKKAAHLKENVTTRLQEINNIYDRLCKLAKARHGYLEDVIKVYSFHKECDDFEDWMIEKETALENDEPPSHNMETVITKFGHLLTDLVGSGSRFDKINKMADEFVKTDHSQKQDVMDRQKEIKENWEKVNQLREARLSYSMDLYSQAWHETNSHILKKTTDLGNNDDIMQTKEQSAVQALVRNHEDLEKELAQVKDKITALGILAKALRISYPTESDVIVDKQREITLLWDSLYDKVLDRIPKINAAQSMYNFYDDSKDMKYPEILAAALDKDLSKIQFLIEIGHDVNTVYQDGFTCLHIAAAAGDVDIVKYVISAGIDIEKENMEKMTAISLAAQNNHQDIVKLLIDSRANVNTSDKEMQTPLHWAVMRGHTEIVKILVNAGASLETKSRDSAAPIHLASTCGHADIVKILVVAGVDKEILGKYNCTPIICAAQYEKCAEVVQYLINVGVNLEAKTTTDCTALHWAARAGNTRIVKTLILAGANMESNEPGTAAPIHMACYCGQLHIVKLFIEAGVDKDIQGFGSWTPLICAILGGHVEIVKYLIDAGANIEAVDGHNSTPLHWAAEEGNTLVVEMLIDEGANVESRDESNATPVHRACLHGKLDVLKFFIDAGIDTEIQGPHGCTPLSCAAGHGHSALVEYLIGIGADIEAGNIDNTPLMYAAMKGHPQVAKILIDAGADKDARNKNKSTALMWASGQGHEKVVKILVDAGADKNAVEESGRTALRYALEQGHRTITKYLTD